MANRSERAAAGEGNFADVAQLVEHSLGKGEVISSILIIGSRDSSCKHARDDRSVADGEVGGRFDRCRLCGDPVGSL